jgi:hypothetical protein
MQIIDASRFSRSFVSTPTREGGMAGPNLAALLERTTRTSGRAKVAILRWPITAASMRALSELGLSDVKIAGYLKVRTEQVTSL